MYVVYLTEYLGDLMPKFYIGSSSHDNVVNKGYKGTVSSKKWRNIWNRELKENPHLFQISILEECTTRKEAYIKEYEHQKRVGVMKNDNYINEIYSNVNFGEYILLNGSPVKGKSPYTNIISGIIKFFGPSDDINLLEWRYGGQTEDQRENTSKRFKESFYFHDPITKKQLRFKIGQAPEGWIRGRSKFNNKGFEIANSKENMNNIFDININKRIGKIISLEEYNDSYNYFYIPRKINLGDEFFGFNDYIFESWVAMNKFCKQNNYYLPARSAILVNKDIKFYGRAINIIKGKQNEKILKQSNNWQEFFNVIPLEEIKKYIKDNNIKYTINGKLIKRKVDGYN